MGSLFKSKQSAPTVTGDPVAQESFNIIKPGLQQATSQGMQLANEFFANPAFSGQRVAGLNPFQTGSANTLGGFADRFTPAAQGSAAALGFSNLGAGANFGNNAQNIFSQFSGDPTQQIINNAGQFANNPYISGLIDASSRDVTRNLFENQLPGINLAATGAGGLNSTRAGVESAIAQRGAADRLADMSSQIRSQFFGQGLGMAQNQYNQNLQNMLQSNQGLMQAGQFGLDALGNAQNLAQTGFGQGQLAGGLFQGQEQAQLDANRAQFDEGLANRLAVLGQLTNNNASGQGFKSVAGVTPGAQQQSLASQLGGLALGAASAWKAFSDTRMKENVSKIGETATGLGVYSFEYKPEFKDIAGHGSFVGVMAQEVEQAIPEAVSVADNGYMMVDYSKVN
jgi:hypothetical protein